MYRLIQSLHLNRIRVQMLLGFLFVIATVLTIAGAFVYKTLSDLLIEEAEQYVGETALQASARLDAVFAQVDSLTLQLITDPRIQDLLYKVHIGDPVSIEEKMSVRPILYHLMAFSWQIESIELYAGDEPFYPLENQFFSIRIGQEAATFANLREGQLVWTGSRQKDDKHLLAVRQIRLQQDYLAPGGYVVVKLSDALLSFFHTEFSTFKGSTMYLYDQRDKLVAASSESLLHYEQLQRLDTVETTTSSGVSSPIIRIGQIDYLKIVRKSTETNWSVLMLIPLTTIKGGLLVLKQALLWAAVFSILICLLLVLTLSNLITKPIMKLRSKMRSPLGTLPEPNHEYYFNFEMNELNLSYNKLVHELHYMVETVYEKERLKNQAEIKMLQAQINPHFLFNTLESLHWMLMEKQDHVNAKLVIALSRLFRYSIQSSNDEDWISLKEELSHCRMYLEIMKYRLGPRLDWDIICDKQYHSMLLPKLILQPIVENAIQHGIEPRIGAGQLTIKVERKTTLQQSYLVIRIIDNGLGMSTDELTKLQYQLEQSSTLHVQTPGLGLLNVQHRLKLYYGKSYGLQIESHSNEGTIVTFSIPLGVDGYERTSSNINSGG